jgi:acyl-CoA thioester hydrolase
MKEIVYFVPPPGAPAPLEKSVFRTVRFNEVDPMGILWPGLYVGYFADARVALGDSLGIGYTDFFNRGITLPVRQMSVDYLAPLTFGRTYEIKARLFYCDAVRMNYDFTIYDDKHKICTRGMSVQPLVDQNKNLLLERPDFYEKLVQNWKEGKIK